MVTDQGYKVTEAGHNLGIHHDESKKYSIMTSQAPGWYHHDKKFGKDGEKFRKTGTVTESILEGKLR